MKIKSLEIENFKLFDKKFSEISDISKSDIIILNGPNGYGKTSIFDAIEFALTGKIKRINNYSEELGVKKTAVYDKKILITDETKKACISICLQNEEDIIELQRIYNPVKTNLNRASKDNNPYKIFEKFETKLIINNNEIIGDELIKRNLDKYNLNQIEDFYDKCCFLSQDEHLEFLKAAHKDKASALEFLFEIPSEQQKELDRVQKLINNLKNNNRTNGIGYITKLETEEKNKSNEIKELKVNIEKTGTNNITETSYQCLFPDKDVFWDRETILLDGNKYDQAIEEIEKLKFFSEHISSCKDYLYNTPIKKILKNFNGSNGEICKNNKLEYSYRYYSLLINKKDIDSRYALESKYRVVKEKIKSRKLDEISWNFILEENMLEESKIKNIQERLKEVSEIKKTQGIMSNTITQITETRNILIKYIDNAMNQSIIDDKRCSFCGAPYNNREELEAKIKIQTDKLQALCDNAANRIVDIIDILYKDYINSLSKSIESKLNNIISEETFKKLQEVKKNEIIINEVRDLLKSIDIELPEEYENDISKVENGYNELVNEINKKLKYIPEEIELQLEAKDFIHEYEKYYDKTEEKFEKITSNMLDIKINYIKTVFFNSEMKELNRKKEELKIIKNRKEKLEEIFNELTEYQKAIQEGVDSYKMKIIHDIEPILYVYTAKILQKKFNGKSIFISINEGKNDIKFINSVVDNQDILYTMSSGQLAAVSLAFLLCMNQVYAKQALPILLIDDPIQTIDDVNMVGLVDILRYEFEDRQIFISTHEQKFEWYLKYKYEKANKNIKPFNMKKLML